MSKKNKKNLSFVIPKEELMKHALRPEDIHAHLQEIRRGTYYKNPKAYDRNKEKRKGRDEYMVIQ